MVLCLWGLNAYGDRYFERLYSVQGYLISVGLPDYISAPGERVFVFSPRDKEWAAYDAQGYRVAYGPANGGGDYCKDIGRSCRTPHGSFRIISKRGQDCRSSRYPLPSGGSPMPYCMFFHKSGYAVHGSSKIGAHNSSHGCIRVKPDAAHWLHHHFLKIGTKVVVQAY